MLIVEHGKYYELEERGDTVRQTCYLYGSEGLFALVIRTDGRDSVRYCHRDHLGSGEGLMALGGSLKTGAKIAVQSVVGGTLSELGGGNFANGTITAAFSLLFNDVMHDNGNSEDASSDQSNQNDTDNDNKNLKYPNRNKRKGSEQRRNKGKYID